MAAGNPTVSGNKNYTVDITINVPNGYKIAGVGAIANQQWGQTLLNYNISNNVLSILFYNSMSNIIAGDNTIKATIFFTKIV